MTRERVREGVIRAERPLLRSMKWVARAAAIVALATLPTVRAFAQSDIVAPMPPTKIEVFHRPLSDSAYRFGAAMTVIGRRCIACHRPSGSASDMKSLMNSEAAWVNVGMVVPRDLENSLLYKYLQGSGFTPPPLGTMPLGSDFGKDEFTIIKNWIVAMEDPLPDPTPTPDPDGGSYGLSPSSSGPRLGDRIYVKSMLDDVFGPDATAITTAEVENRISIFGGSCDRRKLPPPTGQGDETCENNLDVAIFTAPIVPVSSPSRSGRTMQACNQLVFNDAPVQYAIKRATGRSDLSYLSADPIPTIEQIQGAFRLLNPGEDGLAQSAIDKLLELATTAKEPGKPLDPWRYVLLVLCYDEQTQVS